MQDAPSYSELAAKAGISRGYAHDLLKGSPNKARNHKPRQPSQSLAIHIYRTTGWKHPRIANLTDEQIDALAEILAAAA